MLLGKYPEDGLAVFGKDMPKFKPADLDEMKQPIDFLGLNIYKADTYRRGADGKPERCRSRPATRARASTGSRSRPARMYWGPRFFYERYKLPLSITENGLATRDQVFLDGKVHDPQRIDFMHRYLLELRARDQGRRAGAPATTPGRCSTTSSGPTATSSASAWSTSTTRTRSASRRTRSTGTGR